MTSSCLWTVSNKKLFNGSCCIFHSRHSCRFLETTNGSLPVWHFLVGFSISSVQIDLAFRIDLGRLWCSAGMVTFHGCYLCSFQISSLNNHLLNTYHGLGLDEALWQVQPWLWHFWFTCPLRHWEVIPMRESGELGGNDSICPLQIKNYMALPILSFCIWKFDFESFVIMCLDVRLSDMVYGFFLG